MSDDGFDLTLPSGLAEYRGDQSLYRAITYNDWLKKNNIEVRHPMFYRFRKDTSGLSVDITPEDCRANFQEPIFGIVDITAGQIRAVTTSEKGSDCLDVVPTTTTHGNIKKVPYRDENTIESTHIAKQLARFAHVFEHYRSSSTNPQT